MSSHTTECQPASSLLNSEELLHNHVLALSLQDMEIEMKNMSVSCKGSMLPSVHEAKV